MPFELTGSMRNNERRFEALRFSYAEPNENSQDCVDRLPLLLRRKRVRCLLADLVDPSA